MLSPLTTNADIIFVSVLEELDRFRGHFEQLLHETVEKAKKEYVSTGPGPDDVKKNILVSSSCFLRKCLRLPKVWCFEGELN